VTSVKPTVVAGWDVTIGKETLDKPVSDGEGGTITDRVGTVTYTASTPLPDELRQVFPISLKMPDAAGTKLAFPIVQTCVEGETAWITVPKDGEAEPEHPAPVVSLTNAPAADDDGNVDTATPVSSADGNADVATAASTDDDGGDGLAIAGIVVGALGLAAGGAALVRTRRA
jgi:hypothetical protein